ncbi:MAG: 30S ribosomal protein S6 [Planctomycetota bacterium]
MAENVYEGLFIFDGNKYARDNAALPTAVEKMITELGGDIKVSRLWEERRLAYPIRGQRKGAYWLIYFAFDPSQITALNRKCELRDGVLRQLILKIHPRLVEPILSHATGEVDEAPAEEQAAEAPAPSAPPAQPDTAQPNPA